MNTNLLLSPGSEANLPLSTPSTTRTQSQSLYNRRESSTSSTSTIAVGNTKVNSTNYVSLSRSSTSKRRLSSFYKNSSSIKGPFAINPYMHVPSGLLASLPESDEENPAGRLTTNLRLDCQNGGIDVDLYLTGDPSKAASARHAPNLKERALLNLELKDGLEPGLDRFPLIARIHTPELARPPFQLCATAINGYVSIHLPSSFQGLLTIHVGAGDLERHIEISTNLLDHSVVLRETNDSRSYFVGEMGGWMKGENTWDGDEVIATVENGLVRAQFQDENASDMVRKVLWRYVGV
ncbi:hypothetical protein ONZ45_g7671 [Pleurotus djamor]|nr:hypothetical protein ONZ45_g7671 [Pleurotus djamor]